MNKLLTSSKQFLKHNSSTILTFSGAIGVLVTTVSAVKATPKAMILISEDEKNKGRKLTKLETIQTAGKVYIPSILIGCSTIACIFGANIINQKQQASFLSLYSLLDSSYKEYKDKVEELYGEGANKNVEAAIASDHLKEGKLGKNTDGKVWFFDYNSLQFFESTFDSICEAEDFINEILSSRGDIYLDEYNGALGLPTRKSDYEMGWTCESLTESNVEHLELSYEKITSDDGDEFYVLKTNSDPIILW